MPYINKNNQTLRQDKNLHIVSYAGVSQRLPPNFLVLLYFLVASMKNGNWIPIDKKIKFWLPKTRTFTEIEALISHTLDVNDNISYSINGYSALWGWSRCKVRNFINHLRHPDGHHLDRHKDSNKTSTRQGITLKNINLQDLKDSNKTEDRQADRHQLDSQQDTTNKTKTNTKTNTNKKTYMEFVFLLEEEHLKLVSAFGKQKTDEFITRLNNYIGSTGKKYKSHYHTILNWHNKDKQQDKGVRLSDQYKPLR